MDLISDERSDNLAHVFFLGGGSERDIHRREIRFSILSVLAGKGIDPFEKVNEPKL